MNPILIPIGVLIALSLWVVLNYNALVRIRQQVNESWSGIDTELKRRYDLIPNLVETVKGYAAHEKGIFENIAEARTKYFQAKDTKEQIEAAGGLERALSRLLLLREAYPELKANENFLKLQDSLEGTENRISVERKRYNDSVRTLNTYIRTVFGRFFAGLAGVTKAEYYEVPEAEKEVPKVKF